ncbi:hypothetical protein ZIOFF_019870 [Zingiber officinale]|uniref:Uncharacterized protein n=1 Tax=Zingiber officinale TaxID=94328 RepID=A0A8J5LNA4_ZINOF|nr:hypothetical protein ZIOFF_019870 [Zingiber officinale]
MSVILVELDPDRTAKSTRIGHLEECSYYPRGQSTWKWLWLSFLASPLLYVPLLQLTLFRPFHVNLLFVFVYTALSEILFQGLHTSAKVPRWSKNLRPSSAERRFRIARASSETDEKEGDAPPEQSAVSVENLPLESKLQMKLEQKLRIMKLTKRIRLRKKRLLRKQRMRKNGRWPPSKMKKLNTV